MKLREGVKPGIYVEAETIPEAHWKAMEAVWQRGVPKRTQYDRKNPDGSYIDPPSKEAQVWLRVMDPFAEPRFCPSSHSNRGEYILEMLGVKNDNVLSRDELLKGIDEGNLGGNWPYHYLQRLEEMPTASGPVDQIANVVDRLADDVNTRRAVMTTRCPEIDVGLWEDIPCLGELHFTCIDDVLSVATYWRSRDGLKGMPDNMIGVTYRTRRVCEDLSERVGRPIIHGSYDDMSTSLHIYGQDFANFEVGGEKKSFFENFPTAEDYIARSMESAVARDVEILDQMKEMASQKKIAEWKLSPEKIAIVEKEIARLESGYTP